MYRLVSATVLCSVLFLSALAVNPQSGALQTVLQNAKHDSGVFSFPVKKRSVKHFANKGVGRISGMRPGFPPDMENMGAYYTLNITAGVGEHEVILDTGSSNTWIGSCKPYVPSPFARLNTTVNMTITYGSGEATGEVFKENLIIADGLYVGGITLGIMNMNDTEGFPCPLDGILGVGPQDLTLGTLTNLSGTYLNETILTVTDLLYQQRLISEKTLGVSFRPDQMNETDGYFTFGGVVPELFVPPLFRAPPANQTSLPAYYFGTAFESLTYGNETINGYSDCIVDTGTNVLILPDSAYAKYKEMTSSIVDNNTGLLLLPPDEVLALSPLIFDFDSFSMTLNYDAQVWPYNRVKDDWDGDCKKYAYLPVVNATAGGFPPGDCLLGGPFFERVYTSFTTIPGDINGPGVVDFAKAPWAEDIINTVGC